jgi:hypothetical protein
LTLDDTRKCSTKTAKNGLDSFVAFGEPVPVLFILFLFGAAMIDRRAEDIATGK